ncbi:MAG TPA: flagellar hook protein FlgE [Novimethylophilus sp.]|jgi:flagellar hook protein FlgE|uniref:flagellar hook protein FlgE n=1 Tax=Novimethylophilus sp. TaxID=2137426 RepID=UPI002F401E22
MGFQQGLSGLNVSAKNLDVIGNNVANAGTVGYKSGAAEFADVFAASLTGGGASPVGLGSKVSSVVQQFTQGNITSTNNPLDIAINGGGLFRVSNSGAITYTRNGQFQMDKNGFIVTSNGLRLTGYPATSAGLINTGALSDLQISSADIAPLATGASVSGAKGVVSQLNLDSRAAVPPTTPFVYTDPTSYNNSTALTVYDSLGSPSTYSLYFVKTAANAWNVYSSLTNPAGATTQLQTPPAKLGALTFTTAGALTGVSSFTESSVTSAILGTGAAAMSFPVDFTGSTQFGGKFAVNTLTQDGFTLGRLSGFNVGKDGVITGRYTNGQSKSLGQVVLASFKNAQGLQPLGDNNWAETSNSGTALLNTPGASGSYGALQSAAVEDSNVDLTAELVNMITAQRVYQANAQTIKTQDQVLQTLVNLR